VKPKESLRFEQSAALPYRGKGDRLEVLLVTSSRGRRWVIPKGFVERDLSPAESAAKEALEEAGVEGRLGLKALGTYTYEKWGGVCEVEVFPLRVKRVRNRWEEDFRQREWVSVEEAVRRLVGDELRRIVEGLRTRLG